MKGLYKALVFTLLLVATRAYGQCGYDSLGGGGSGIAELDTAVIMQLGSRCTECPTVGFVAWQLPFGFNGNVTLFSPNADTVSIQITTGCDSLLLDTCTTLPAGFNQPLFVLTFAVFGDVQIVVNGQLGDTIRIDCKSTPSPQEELYPPYLDLSTCSPVVFVELPEEEVRSWWAWDLVSGRHEREFLPLKKGNYFEAIGETFAPPFRKIRVH